MMTFKKFELMAEYILYNSAYSFVCFGERKEKSCISWNEL